MLGGKVGKWARGWVGWLVGWWVYREVDLVGR